MGDESFFKEFSGLLKKHFFKKKRKAKPRKAGHIKRFFRGAKPETESRQPFVSVGSVHHDSANITDRKKQQKIEALCEKLFEQRDMISSGKLNFLGLDKIKKRLGKSWEGIKPIVYETVDSSIRKYMEEGDLFIRYREDVYLIIFAKASHDEAQIKSALIAEEIRRRLFETEHEELQEMEIKREVRTVKTETLRGKQSLEETFDKIFSGKIDVDALKRNKAASAQGSDYPDGKPHLSRPAAIAETAPPSLPAGEKQEPRTLHHAPQENPPETRKPNFEIIEVETYRKKETPQKKAIADYDLEQEFSFIPVWDIKRSYLSTYICVLDREDKAVNPYAAHKEVYKTLSHSQMLEYDKAVLWRVIKEFADRKGANKNMFLCCPVHYETLVRDSSFTNYKIACQEIPEELRNFLFFMVMDCPAQVHQLTLSKFVGPLRNYCRFFCGEVPFDSKVDFLTYRMAGFHSVGIDLPQMDKHTQDIVAPAVRKFSEQAKKHFITFIFALGIYDTELISAAVFPDYDFAAGGAIHKNVSKPDGIYKFRYQDIYSKMVDEKAEVKALPERQPVKKSQTTSTE